MRWGTREFLGEAGRHSNESGVDCWGRKFEAKSVGVGGIFVNVVACTTCRCELAASEQSILGPAPYSASANPAA